MKSLFRLALGFILAVVMAPASAQFVLHFTGDPGDYISQGQTYHFTLADGAFVGGSDFGDLNFGINIRFTNLPPGLTDYWTLSLAGPNGGVPGPGTYSSAERWPFQSPGHPGLDFSGNGRGCNTVTGSFTVQESVIVNGVLQKYSADFEQHCEGSAPALRGSIRYNSTVPLPSTSTPAPSGPAIPPPLPVQDIWWSGVAENGWGMSIVQHGEQLFAVIYAYDGAGASTWYAIPGGTWNAARTVFTGSVYVPSGTPFFAYDASRWSVGAQRGTVTLTFQGTSFATLDYTIDGVTGSKPLLRQPFGRPGFTPQAGVGDMWWAGAAQNGWGIAVLQQQSSLFSVLYTYDANGAPRWLVMPDGAWTSNNTFEGRIYRTSSSPWLGPYDRSLFRVNDVGSFKLRFAGDGAVFEYVVDGRSGSIPISRNAF